MSFPNDWIGLAFLVFGVLVIIGAWMDRASMFYKHDEEDRLKKEVRDWIETRNHFVAVRWSGGGWRWVVDPWRLPWTDTKWEIYYDEVFDTKSWTTLARRWWQRSGD